MKLLISLSLPPTELSPNARPHYMAKANKVKLYREEARFMATCARRQAGHSEPWAAAQVRVIRYGKTRRRIDRDNILASLKAAFDGIASAGVVADDSDLTYLPVELAVDTKRPRVEIEITETPSITPSRIVCVSKLKSRRPHD